MHRYGSFSLRLAGELRQPKKPASNKTEMPNSPKKTIYESSTVLRWLFQSPQSTSVSSYTEPHLLSWPWFSISQQATPKRQRVESDKSRDFVSVWRLR